MALVLSHGEKESLELGEVVCATTKTKALGSNFGSLRKQHLKFHVLLQFICRHGSLTSARSGKLN